MSRGRFWLICCFFWTGGRQISSRGGSATTRRLRWCPACKTDRRTSYSELMKISSSWACNGCSRAAFITFIMLYNTRSFEKLPVRTWVDFLMRFNNGTFKMHGLNFSLLRLVKIFLFVWSYSFLYYFLFDPIFQARKSQFSLTQKAVATCSSTSDLSFMSSRDFSLVHDLTSSLDCRRIIWVNVQMIEMSDVQTQIS